MSGLLSYQCRDGVAVLTLQHPPVNALNLAVRKGLLLGIEHALGDAKARAVVLQGSQDHFSSGVDLSEYDHPLGAPWLAEVCRAIEDCSKPVVAALQGRALGAAFELALACHGRVAQTETRLGLPDVALGLPAGSGGAMRAARLAGAGAALDLLLSGRVIRAAHPAAQPFLDRVVDEPPLEAALALAKTLAASGPPCPASAREEGFADPVAYQAAIKAAREGFGGTGAEDDPAASALIAAVEAAQLLPPEVALEFETAQFEELVGGARSASLRHLYAAERRAPRHFGASGPAQLTTIAVVGRGGAAAGLAISALDAGLQVVLVDPDGDGPQALATGAEVARTYHAAAQAGHMTEEHRKSRLARLKVTDTLSVIRAGDLAVLLPLSGSDGAALIEAACAHSREGTALLIMGQLPPAFAAAAGARAADLAAILFERPAHLARMGEIALPESASPATEAAALGLMRRLRMIAVGARGRQVLSRHLLLALRRACDEMLALGTSPYAIDAALRAAGIGHGAYLGIDAMGLRASAFLAESGLPEGEAHEAVSALQNTLIAADRLGASHGAGFYDHADGTAQPDQVVLDLQQTLLRETDHGNGPLGAAEIAQRAEAALVGAAARLLEEKVAFAVGDIDVAAVHGLGYRRAFGGPLHHANQDGVYTRAAAMRRFAAAALRPKDQSLWTPCALLADMVKNGRKF